MAKTLNFPLFSCLVNQNNIFCPERGSALKLRVLQGCLLAQLTGLRAALAKLGLAFTVLLAFGNEFTRGRGVLQFHVNYTI